MLRYLTCLAILGFTLRTEAQSSCPECGPCEVPPRNCSAGFVRDACNCCYVCGLKEGERCDLTGLENGSPGKCGENLRCELRTDLDEGDPPEAICTCVYKYWVCGSDDKTYKSVCKLHESRNENRNGLKVAMTEPCYSRPQITNYISWVTEPSGSPLAVKCEVVGWPLPTITWYRGTVRTHAPISSDDPRISVQVSNGPGVNEISSWLLISELASEDSGEYACNVVSSVGDLWRGFRINVIDQK